MFYWLALLLLNATTTVAADAVACDVPCHEKVSYVQNHLLWVQCQNVKCLINCTEDCESLLLCSQTSVVAAAAVAAIIIMIIIYQFIKRHMVLTSEALGAWRTGLAACRPKYLIEQI